MKKILCAGTLIADIISEKAARLPSEGECITRKYHYTRAGMHSVPL
ncbi:MAG TPA: hypothetical protein PLE24_13040 [Chitinispirillaceae bacterium]|jgi:hypothetical protein|nr:hypothetical protein [Chitinispirillaceae bacterium]